MRWRKRKHEFMPAGPSPLTPAGVLIRCRVCDTPGGTYAGNTDWPHRRIGDSYDRQGTCPGPPPKGSSMIEVPADADDAVRHTLYAMQIAACTNLNVPAAGILDRLASLTPEQRDLCLTIWSGHRDT